jgi:hypothetical protein
VAAGTSPGRWRVTWLIENDADSLLQLKEAWIPHGRFRGDGHVRLDRLIEPRRQTVLELSVSADEPPGTMVENAFLILRTPEGRIFARMRVSFEADGTPVPVVEKVTLQ